MYTIQSDKGCLATQDHYEIVRDSLNENGIVDEQTFASIHILAERLESVRKLHRAFIDIEFSPQVQALAEQESKLAVS
jgi:hypothetical protein